MAQETFSLLPALRRIFVPPYADRIGLVLEDARPSVPLADLLEGGGLGPWLDLTAARYREPDARGVASYWAQCYVQVLLPAALVANLVLCRELPLEPARSAVILDPESGLPLAIRIAHDGEPMPAGDVFARTRTLIEAHLQPLAAALAARARMSPRVVLGSAAFLAIQVVQMLVAQGALSDLDGQRYGVLFSRRQRGDGSVNPFFQPVTHTAAGRTGLFKRVCCLSYTLPELGRCGSCPRA